MEGRECRTCNQFKEWSEFNKGNALNGKKSECRICQSKRAKEYKKRPEVRERSKIWQRERHAKRTSQERTERYLKRKEYLKEYQKEWRKTPKGKAKVRRDGNKRYAWRRNLDPLTSLHIKILEDYNRERNGCLVCEYCGCNIDDSYTIDHVVPIVKGGDNVITNLLLCCQSCNSKKCAKDLEEIFPSLIVVINDILENQRKRYQKEINGE